MSTPHTHASASTAPPWLAQRARVLREHIATFGMSLDAEHAAALITERVTYLIDVLGMDPPTARARVDDDAIRSLAEELVFTRADEAPGAQLLEAIRDTPITLDQSGHAIACLSEAAKIHSIDPAALGHVRTHETLTCISEWALLQTQAGVNNEPITVPRALLHRSARLIDQAAATATRTTPQHPMAHDENLPDLLEIFTDAATYLRDQAAPTPTD